MVGELAHAARSVDWSCQWEELVTVAVNLPPLQ
jgi:hypothetical protein